ncbi:alkaline phosphatase D family protein [Uliginosibacterium sp. H1]|uniref:alkaline phosphatase D family protein n=1 Tax=Uliginosibacterium sp. H1 TaxID=3114757 RepID=UPI002E189488|nr:alkaline phosphatase D family protein [Uliginosibacterium sp. H1]
MQRRDLLKLLVASAMAPTASGLLAAVPRFRDDPFALGVASGAPDHRSVVLWTRLVHAGLLEAPAIERAPMAVRWELAEDEHFRRGLRSGEATALPQFGHAVHVEVDGLAADRWYHYRFSAGDAVSITGRTRTLPAPEVLAPRLRFGIASCQHWNDGYYAAWRHLLAEQPDLVLFVGDYIYESASRKDAVRAHPLKVPYRLADYRLRYQLYRSDPHLQAMHAACPWLVTWDDHEVLNNYAGLQGGAKGPADPAAFASRRAAAYQAWYEHMPVRASVLLRGLDGLGRPDALRIYGRFDVGRLASFHLLDDRQYRDWQACRDPENGGDPVEPALCAEWADPRRTLLGDEQESWLHAGLRRDVQRGTRWTVIAQQTQFTPRDSKIGKGERYGTDNWNGYPAARERLIGSLLGSKPANPVFVGGDIHQNWVADVRARPDGPAIAAEFIGTSISSASGQAQARLDATVRENPHCHFASSEVRGYGLVELTPQRWTTTLRGLDDVSREDSGVRTLASFVVEDGKAGVQRA